MKEGPVIASVAALIGDPARANMLTALMDGRALTVSELAEAAGVTLPTASSHLARLDAANLLAAERQGRHRYFRLADPEVARVLEALMGLAERTGAKRVRTGPRDAELRTARICYDHLAGERGVALLATLKRAGRIAGEDELTVPPEGRAFFVDFGIDMDGLEKARRPVCKTCLDWSERRSHLGGALGAALLDRFLAEGWARRDPGRVIAFSGAGLGALRNAFGEAIAPAG
ncbi:ArsR/SmtB family transcription factor [Kaistia adipata]|uniref:ArsR/SmtB family transcription factor n=1 Tax=Kaistia adipata TaxID=166954 RepID=UPI0003FF2822|nr:winged helix-turn-helix domain-containing protein [Kaistia adipata]